MAPSLDPAAGPALPPEESLAELVARLHQLAPAGHPDASGEEEWISLVAGIAAHGSDAAADALAGHFSCYPPECRAGVELAASLLQAHMGPSLLRRARSWAEHAAPPVRALAGQVLWMFVEVQEVGTADDRVALARLRSEAFALAPAAD